MVGTSSKFVLSLVGVLAFSFAAEAQAQRATRRTRNTATRTRTTRARTTRPKPKPTNKVHLRATSRKQEVSAAFKELFKEAHNGYAAAMYVIPHAGIKETVVQAQGDYGSGKSQIVKVSGLGSSGEYKADFLGSVSTHNEGARFVENPAGMKNFIKNRVAQDGVKIIHIAPSGKRTELVANHPSEIVTQLQLNVKLEKGKNIIRYERTDRSTGRIVSAQGLYGEWREKHIEWNGN